MDVGLCINTKQWRISLENLKEKIYYKNSKKWLKINFTKIVDLTAQIVMKLSKLILNKYLCNIVKRHFAGNVKLHTQRHKNAILQNIQSLLIF